MKGLKQIKLLLAACFAMLVIFGNSALEAEAASPGLYNSKGKMVYSWNQLLDDTIVDGGILKLKDGVLKTRFVVVDEADSEDDVVTSLDVLDGKLVIPEGVTVLDNNALDGCSLTEVVLPNSLKTILTEAFAWSSIEKITIPKNVNSIGKRVFMYLQHLLPPSCLL